MRFAAIEGGGTTWVATICEDKPDNIVERMEIKTTTDPVATITPIKDWLRTKQFDAIGLASFGPLGLNPHRPDYGFITSTPKQGWRDTDILTILGLRAGGEFSHIPWEFDTDVNAPALAEYKLFGKPGTTSGAYFTVGTGVGVGLVINGQSVKGLTHPEMGHICIKRREGDTFAGVCPYHSDCVEGMCNSAALAKRKGCATEDLAGLSDDDPIWDYCAFYLAEACVTLILTVSPEKICIGGGILNRSVIMPKIRSYTLSLLAGYVVHDFLTPENIESYICPSVWGSKAGVVGTAYLAQVAIERKNGLMPPPPVSST